LPQRTNWFCLQRIVAGAELDGDIVKIDFHGYARAPRPADSAYCTYQTAIAPRSL
jgi:hypothetical protein